MRWERLEALVAAVAVEAQVVRCRSLSGRSPSCQPRPCSRPPAQRSRWSSGFTRARRVSRRSSSRHGTKPPVTRRWPPVWRGRRSANPGRTADTQGLHGPRSVEKARRRCPAAAPSERVLPRVPGGQALAPSGRLWSTGALAAPLGRFLAAGSPRGKTAPNPPLQTLFLYSGEAQVRCLDFVSLASVSLV